MAVFLLGAAFASSWLLGASALSASGVKGVLGGPAAQFADADFRMLFATVQSVPHGIAPPSVDNGPGIAAVAVDAASLNDAGEPIGPAYSRSSIITYKVVKGDNLSEIAANFGISLQTVINANPEVRGSVLKIGQELKILPASGAVYKVQDGDTIESISQYYNIPIAKIKALNSSANFASLEPGTVIVLPGVQIAAPPHSELVSSINPKTYFVMPAQGYDWGILHHYNAVDIANTCGTPVVAAAEGLVIPDENFGDGLDGWNGGYGKFVLIEHPAGNGLRTRYAHLEKVLVSIGDYVKQGQEIGLMGQTGDATGCHVHFEVYGAENPFAK